MIDTQSSVVGPGTGQKDITLSAGKEILRLPSSINTNDMEINGIYLTTIYNTFTKVHFEPQM